MPSINVNGRYCLFPYVGASASTTFRDNTYVNNICSVSTPNPLGFTLYLPYIPGLTQPNQGLTTIAPGSSYQIISRDAFATVPWSITYAGSDVDRLPLATNVKTPLFMIGLDKNSIVVPISSYVSGLNSPLSSIGQMRLTNGKYASINQFNAADVKNGLYFGDTHFRPNSAYRLRTRVPFTFFAPLQSEMGSIYAVGENLAGQFGMGYRQSNYSFPGDNIYGNWDKIVLNNFQYNCSDGNQTIFAPSIAALSSCGTSKALFVLGNNVNGQLGTGSSQQYYSVWTRVPGQWLDVELGNYHMLAINSQGHLYACGDNTYGQLGLGSGVINTRTLSLVNQSRYHMEIAATGLGTMARDSNGFLYACGNNREGKLGVGNNTSIIYTLTQEVLGYTWISVKAGRPNAGTSDPSTDYFVAIRSNNTLYGVGTALVNSYFGSNNTNNIPYTFKQEGLGFTDVTSIITTIKGTFIQRRNQNNYFAAGDNLPSDRNPLAIFNGSTSTNFLETYIPSDARAIANYYNLTTTGIGTSYIRNNIRYSKTSGNSFTQDTNNYINTFTDSFTTFTVGGVLPTPTPTQTPTRTPTPTPTPTLQQVKFKTQGFMSGNWPQSLQSVAADYPRDGGTSNSGWSTNILFNEPAGRDNCNSQVYNNYSSILVYDYGANSTNPAQNTRVYRHYSNRTFESAQMEPQSFGGRNCYVFNGYSSGPGNSIIDSSKLCFQYFSQNFPRAEYCSMIGGTNPVGYLQPIYSKMAPNSGTFQDNRNSKQRIEIDSSEIGNSAMTDFFINPINNSYHVLYHKKINPSSSSDYSYYFYYTNSYDRGNTWSTPKLVQNGYFSTYLNSSQAGPYLGQLFCSRGMPNDHLVVIDTNRQLNSNTPKPAALFSVTAGNNNIYKVVCAYTYSTPLDSFDELATQTSLGNAVNFHGDIGNLKLLTDQTNSLIAMYCGADTPPSPASSWQTGDGSDGGGIYGAPYTGEAPCRIYYRYCNLNSLNWSAQREIGKTFPRRGLFDSFPSVNPFGKGIIGRIWDACIDESDNTLCIVYTPTVDRNTTRSAKWSFCAWKLYVKKVNIYTNTTIFDELVYDITSHGTSSGTSFLKTITVSNIYYDTQRSSLVVCAHTAYDTTLGDGAGVTLQRAGTNSWTYLGQGPFSGSVYGSRKYKLITQKYV